MRVSSVSSIPTDSPLHRLDVRVKMFIAALAAIMTVAISSLNAQLVLFIASFAYLLLVRRFALIAVSYAFCFGMMALAAGFGFLIAHLIPMTAKSMQLSSLVIPFLRAFTVLNVILPLAFTGRLQEILSALQSMRLPFVIYLPAAVIVRFIPTFAHDVKQIWESLKIRGYKINPWSCTIHPFRTMRLLFTPLLFRALKTSDELGIAAELKGLHAGSRSGSGEKRPFKKTDYCGISLTVAVCTIALFLQIYFPAAIGVLK